MFLVISCRSCCLSVTFVSVTSLAKETMAYFLADPGKRGEKCAFPVARSVDGKWMIADVYV